MNGNFEEKKSSREHFFQFGITALRKINNFLESGYDGGQAPLGYPQEQYEDGAPPLSLSRSEDIRAGDNPRPLY